jgi:hypothetical protein
MPCIRMGFYVQCDNCSDNYPDCISDGMNLTKRGLLEEARRLGWTYNLRSNVALCCDNCREDYKRPPSPKEPKQ